MDQTQQQDSEKMIKGERFLLVKKIFEEIFFDWSKKVTLKKYQLALISNYSPITLTLPELYLNCN